MEFAVARHLFDWPVRATLEAFDERNLLRAQGLGKLNFEFSFRVRVSGFEVRVSCFVLRVLCFELRASCLVFWVSGFGFRASGFDFRVQGF